MEAEVGDAIVVDSAHLGEPVRHGEVLEVLGEGDRLHYRVRWDDGHETIFFPGPDAHVRHAGRAGE